MSKLEKLQKLVNKYEVYVSLAEKSISKKEAKIALLKEQGNLQLAKDKQIHVNSEKAELKEYKAKIAKYTRLQAVYS